MTKRTSEMAIQFQMMGALTEREAKKIGQAVGESLAGLPAPGRANVLEFFDDAQAEVERRLSNGTYAPDRRPAYERLRAGQDVLLRTMRAEIARRADQERNTATSRQRAAATLKNPDALIERLLKGEDPTP